MENVHTCGHHIGRNSRVQLTVLFFTQSKLEGRLSIEFFSGILLAGFRNVVSSAKVGN